MAKKDTEDNDAEDIIKPETEDILNPELLNEEAISSVASVSGMYEGWFLDYAS